MGPPAQPAPRAHHRHGAHHREAGRRSNSQGSRPALLALLSGVPLRLRQCGVLQLRERRPAPDSKRFSRSATSSYIVKETNVFDRSIADYRASTPSNRSASRTSSSPSSTTSGNTRSNAERTPRNAHRRFSLPPVHPCSTSTRLASTSRAHLREHLGRQQGPAWWTQRRRQIDLLKIIAVQNPSEGNVATPKEYRIGYLPQEMDQTKTRGHRPEEPRAPSPSTRSCS